MFGFFRRKSSNKDSVAAALRAFAESPGEARKARSNALLKSRGIVINPRLPQLGEDAEALRSTEHIFRRMRARMVYFMRGQFAMEDAPLAEFRGAMDSLNAWNDLTPVEKECVESTQPTEQQIIDSSWSVEGVYALAWSLGLIDDLPWPAEMCDVPRVMDVMKKTTAADGLSTRPLGELLDQADLHYRLHWACRQLMQLEG